MVLSVIIPAYNVEGTLTRCMKSVLSQGVDDMEVILVDDGSTDGTSKLCDDYAKNGKVTVVHQKNAGLSEARNTGIGIAKGELITFVDSDDFIATGTYKPLTELMLANPKYDILEYPIVREDGLKILLDLDLQEKEYTDMREYWLVGKAYNHTFACNKIYRRKLFSSVNFPKGKKFEDVFTLPKLLKHCRCVRTTSNGLYHYTYNTSGITVSADGAAWRDLLDANMKVIADEKLRQFKEFEDYYAYVLNIQISTYERSGRVGDIILPTLPYYKNLKLKVLHLIGMKNLCKLFRLKYRLLG